MLTKKFLLKILTAFAIVIAPAASAFADTDDSDAADANNNSRIYIKGFYNPSYIWKSNLSPINKNVAEGSRSDTLLKTDRSNTEYLPTYSFSPKGGGAAVGWQFDNIIIEIEGSLNIIKPVPEGYLSPPLNPSIDHYTYLPPDRAPALLDESGSYATYMAKNIFTVNGSAGAVPAYPIFQNNPKYLLGMLNAYYNIQMESLSPIKPYIGVGAGLARLTFKTSIGNSTSYPVALQAKVGAAFEVSKYFAPYIGYKLLYILPKEIILNTNNFVTQDTPHAFKTSTLVLNVALHPKYLIHNLEAGIIFSLAS